MARAFEDAARHANFWEGRELVAYEPVGIPMFAVQLDVVVQRKKPIPPIEEFALRAVQDGVTTMEAVSGFLGLEARLAEEGVLNQLQSANLVYQPDDQGVRSLGLTGRGVEALGNLAGYAPERTEILVIFDRMTRLVVGTEDRGLARPAAFQQRSLRARPPVAPPTARDISADDVNVALAKSEGLQRARRKAEAEFQLIGIKKVVRADRRYKAATLLVFRSRKSGSLDAGVVADGRPSTIHTQAMAELGGLTYLEIDDASIAAKRGIREAMRLVPGLRDDAVERGADLDTAVRELVDARRRMRDPDIEHDPGEGVTVTPRDAARRAYEEAGQRLLHWPMRRALAWEHPLLLEFGLTAAKRRVIIASPAITDQSAGYDLMRGLEDAASRGVEVTVLLPPPMAVSRIEGDARRRLRELASRRPRIGVREVSVGEPALVWDDTWVAGTFPWLAHEGDPDRSLVAAESIVVHGLESVDQAAARVLSVPAA
jgi:hypothetical protein